VPPADAVKLVGDRLDELLADVTSEAERAALYHRVAEKVRTKPTGANAVTKDDLLGAVTSFWLVVLSSVPAAVPFLLLDDARRALRISNGILLALLFVTGYSWARHTLSNPWIVGLAFLLGGGTLVAAAIALGG
jgi:VIT1/CCC1 family predicted Fe2+/Mn2+ transporter